MTAGAGSRFVPVPTPETLPYWEGAARGELCLQRCRTCDRFYFPPRPFCPRCWSTSVTWEAVSGRGSLYSYLITHLAAPGFEDAVPYAIAVVELEDGPRLMSNIVGIANTPEALVLDMPLEVTFEQRNAMTIPQFRPRGVS
jgi:uncharacterized OB-fold protein